MADYVPSDDEKRVIAWLHSQSSAWDRETASYWAYQIEKGHHHADY